MCRWLRFRSQVDRLLAAMLILLLSPIGIALWVLIRREDGHHALLAVDRIGQQFKPFRMWKFRSMRKDNSDGTAAGGQLTALHDDRITRIGRKMRSLHVDELPQLWNVVRGDMMLLGPRPEAPSYVDADSPDWAQVLAGPPGIAGPTQVLVAEWERAFISHEDNGLTYRSDALPVKLAIDSWYLRRATPSIDLLIAWNLIAQHLPLPGRRGLDRLVANEVPAAVPVIQWREHQI